MAEKVEIDAGTETGKGGARGIIIETVIGIARKAARKEMRTERGRLAVISRITDQGSEAERLRVKTDQGAGQRGAERDRTAASMLVTETGGTVTPRIEADDTKEIKKGEEVPTERVKRVLASGQ